MTFRTVITVLVVVTGVAAGGYVFYNNITVIVNAPPVSSPETTNSVTPRPDFRDRIAGYDALSAREQREAIEAIYKDLDGVEKNDATEELARIDRILISERVKNKDKEGYVPQGWAD